MYNYFVYHITTIHYLRRNEKKNLWEVGLEKGDPVRATEIMNI